MASVQYSTDADSITKRIMQVTLSCVHAESAMQATVQTAVEQPPSLQAMMSVTSSSPPIVQTASVTLEPVSL